MELNKLLGYFSEWKSSVTITDQALQFDDLGATGCFDDLRLHSALQSIIYTTRSQWHLATALDAVRN